MNAFGILIEQIGLFAIYIIVGVMLVKTKVLSQEMLETIARFVLKLALPVLIFINTVESVTREKLMASSSVLMIAILFYLCMYGISKMMAGMFHLCGDKASVYRALTMFGNMGFMGIPIISSIFPDNGILYISIFTIIDQLVLWTVGVKLTTPSGKGKFDPRKLVNPATVAIALAVLIILFSIPIPDLFHIALQKIGMTSTPLAMIYLGGVFACMDIRSYIKKKELYGIVIFKMLLIPIIIYKLLGLFPISDEIQMTVTLIAGMPSMSSIVMMAKASGSEGDYAMGGIFVTTFCSIVTLPVVCWIVSFVS